MRKHLFGFALFVFIVISGVVVYQSAHFVLGEETVSVNPPPIKPVIPDGARYDPASLSYKLRSFEIYPEKDRGVAVVELRWKSDKAPPESLRFNFGALGSSLFDPGTEIGSEVIELPTLGNKVKIVSVTLPLNLRVLNVKKENYQVYLEPAPAPEFGTLVYRPDDADEIKREDEIKRNRHEHSIPAVIRHPR